ncbi:putative ABC transporter peptide-binding protein YtcQ [Paenibacillus albidus]|uniref:ABC transporter peptide-binding protein YtcQ n=1 Tax=Paenibacillus albidus TaxID=2041023 RepID=A0A917BXA1_9BACL|nr:extracellular solute-binding protein [Paenibacillus albidus]GGF59243.1 putative ABC transporter peptide-binding protein YtcQ [Paenibacillus albidus]
MKMNKTGATLLATLMLAATLTGCGGSGNGNKENAEGAGNGQAASAGPVDLEIAQISWGTNLPGDDFVKKELDAKLNLTITQTLVGDQADYENQMNVRAASNNLPDLFIATTKAHLQKLAESGSLLDLTPYLEKLPEYTAAAGEDVLKKGIIGDKQYALPKAGQARAYTYWIRKDWLDKLGLPKPATVDELLEVAKAFTEQDPDGNGKKDTMGLTGTNFQAFEPIFGAYGVTNIFDTTQLFVKDGKVVDTLYEPAMKEALTTIRKFLDAGVVDPELVSNKGTMAQDKAFQGKVGIINIDWAQMVKEDKVKVWKGANPKADWIQLDAPKGPDGSAYSNAVNIGMAGGLWAVPKRLEKEPEKLNKILELFNYTASADGGRLVQFGIKDTHYTLDGDKVVITDKGREEAGYTWLYQFAGREETDYLKTKFTVLATYIDFEANMPRIETLDGFVQSPAGYNAADANRFIEEEMIKFIYGKNNIENYDKFLSTLESTFKYDTYVDAAVEQLNKLGYGK